MTVLLPRTGAPIVEGSGLPTTTHFTWCRLVTDAVNSGQLSGTTAQEAIAAIATALGSPDGTVENIPPQDEADAAFISGSGSLNVFGTLASGRLQLSLTGDVQSPGASYVYGTDADGERTWRYAPIESLVAGANITIDETDPAFPIISAGGGDPVISQDTAPAFPSAYPFWWDSANLQMFYQYDDGTSVQWVEVGVSGGGGGGSGAMTLAGTSAVTGAAATSITLSGLDLAADGAYVIEYVLKNATASVLVINGYFNADTTATNYDTQNVRANNTAFTGGRSNAATVAIVEASSQAVGGGFIRNDLDGKPTVKWDQRGGQATTIDNRWGVTMWRTAANVTAFTMTSLTAGGFAIGSYLKIWKVQ